MRALFGDEATKVPYKPGVTSASPEEMLKYKQAGQEASAAALQKIKDDAEADAEKEAAARRRLAELRGTVSSEKVASQVSGSTAGDKGTTPAVGTSATTTGGVVGGYSTSDLADQYGSYGAGKQQTAPQAAAQSYQDLAKSEDKDYGLLNKGGLVKRRKKKK